MLQTLDLHCRQHDEPMPGPDRLEKVKCALISSYLYKSPMCNAHLLCATVLCKTIQQYYVKNTSCNSSIALAPMTGNVLERILN